MAGILGFGTYTPPQSTVDPNFANLVAQQQAQAGAYEANAQNLAGQQGVQAAENTRQGLASKMANIKSQSNRRGLLYSGIKQAGEAGAQQGAAGQLAGERTAINDKIRDQSEALQNQATQAGFAYQQAQQQAANQNYDNQVQQREARQKAVGGLLGAAGGVLGALGGK
jgi:hypothetical protein